VKPRTSNVHSDDDGPIDPLLRSRPFARAPNPPTNLKEVKWTNCLAPAENLISFPCLNWSTGSLGSSRTEFLTNGFHSSEIGVRLRCPNPREKRSCRSRNPRFLPCSPSQRRAGLSEKRRHFFRPQKFDYSPPVQELTIELCQTKISEDYRAENGRAPIRWGAQWQPNGLNMGPGAGPSSSSSLSCAL